MSFIFLTFLFCATSLASSFPPLGAHPHINGGEFHKRDLTRKINARATWAGWSSIDTIFSFGDSWTDMGFNAQGAQPSLPDYPLGGPGNSVEPSKQFLNYNYISYMAVKYNDSAIEGYDLAVAGATVDNTDIPHGVDDFVTQVEKIYLPIYGAEAAQNGTGNSSQASGHSSRLSGASGPVARRARQRFGRDLRKRRIPWDPASTLFTAYFGVNDVEVSASNATAAASWDREFKTYGKLLDEVSYRSTSYRALANVSPGLPNRRPQFPHPQPRPNGFGTWGGPGPQNLDRGLEYSAGDHGPQLHVGLRRGHPVLL